MKLIVVAVGPKMPRWVDEAFAEYAKRMPRTAKLELVEVRSEARVEGRTVEQMLGLEARIRTGRSKGRDRTPDKRSRPFLEQISDLP